MNFWGGRLILLTGKSAIARLGLFRERALSKGNLMNQSKIGKGFFPNTYNHRFAVVIERNILFFIYFWLPSPSNP